MNIQATEECILYWKQRVGTLLSKADRYILATRGAGSGTVEEEIQALEKHLKKLYFIIRYDVGRFLPEGVIVLGDGAVLFNKHYTPEETKKAVNDLRDMR